jgi:hypothetical protein
MARHGRELRALARACSTTLSFDAAVLAGVPFLGALSRRPIVAGARRIEGILNGTSHYVISAIARGAAFDTAVVEAIARGYAEPDSTADLGGRDAAEKLTILMHLAGRHEIEVEALPCVGLEVLAPGDLAAARALGGTIKPVATANLEPATTTAWVGPAYVSEGHSFARLDGVANALRLTDAAGHTVTFAGPGAGPDVTAGTILDDVIECHWQRPARLRSPGELRRGRQAHPPTLAARATAQALASPDGRWFLSIACGDEFSVCDVVTILLGRQIPPGHVVKVADRVAALTRPVSWESIQQALVAFKQAGIRALALPVIEE